MVVVCDCVQGVMMLGAGRHGTVVLAVEQVWFGVVAAADDCVTSRRPVASSICCPPSPQYFEDDLARSRCHHVSKSL